MQLTTEAHSQNQMKLMTENLKQATRNTRVLSIWMSSIDSLLAESLAVFCGSEGIWIYCKL